MRLKDYAEKEDGKRVWLSEAELSAFIDEAETAQQKIAFLLAGRCGLRRQEIIEVEGEHIVPTDTGHVVRVWDGKGSKYREPPAPQQLVGLVEGISWDMDDDEPLVGTEYGSTVYRWFERAASRRGEETEDRGWDFVGPHDLRRSWGIRVLESGVLPSVVMEWGGWNDWETFRDHYLAEFSPEALRRERGKVGFLADTTPDAGNAGSGDVFSVAQPQGSDAEDRYAE